MTIFRLQIIHPFLISVYPLLALIVWNYNYLIWQDVIRIVLVVLLVVVIALYSLARLQHSYARAALQISLTSFLFFSYGHLLRWLVPQLVKNSGYIMFISLTLVWILSWLIGIWVILRSRKKFQNTTFLLNTVSIAMVCLMLV